VRSSPFFPPDTSLPFTLSDDSAHLFYRICEVQMYIHGKVLCYVIVLLLLHKGTCEILRIIPLHIALEQRNFIYLNTDKAISIELESTTIWSMKQRWKCVNLSAKFWNVPSPLCVWTTGIWVQWITQQVFLTMFIEDENIITCFGLIRPSSGLHPKGIRDM